VELIFRNLLLVRKDFEGLKKTDDLVKACEENSTNLRINFVRTILIINNFLEEWGYSSLASATMWNLNQGQKTMIPLQFEKPLKFR